MKERRKERRKEREREERKRKKGTYIHVWLEDLWKRT